MTRLDPTIQTTEERRYVFAVSVIGFNTSLLKITPRRAMYSAKYSLRVSKDAAKLICSPYI